jgi:GTP:adenosylcobinamide-phosphate guanylyltransferase
MESSTTPFTAIVLAGDRTSGDPLAEAAGVACKSFVPVGGRPMVLRVLDTLNAASQVGSLILCGPSQALIEQEPELNASIEAGRVKWIASRATPSSSTYHALQSLPHNTPVLVTTADHALLTTQIVDVFCAEAHRTGCDVAVGLASHEQVATAFPVLGRIPSRSHNPCPRCNSSSKMSKQVNRAMVLLFPRELFSIYRKKQLCSLHEGL